ncbi:MFP1 attachment factor 1-like [Oryza glaberrima]|uniref:WPP domain-containing protein n=1 Tax=Oryza glaberrima TaxID=4538 RepID=I1P8R5_ORYGL|nr:MFP1 attachment factor 1-like [Oryza glaberrima]
MATDELHSAGAPAGVAAAEEGEGEAAQGFSFSIWPPTQRTRDAVVRRLVDTLGGDTILCKRYGAVPAADAEPAARGIEAEAFDAAAASGEAAATASVEEGIKALQLYSKEVSRRLLDFVKSRSAAAKATAAAAAAAAAPSEGEAPAAPSESEVVDPQPAE